MNQPHVYIYPLFFRFSSYIVDFFSSCDNGIIAISLFKKKMFLF